ncbi:MAG: pyridoxal phosphate-dependent aminotransferase [Treponema sp.]|jgi:alanine-synthesizing transaminase|nr:pyridoxal phosphate-dependent aminotransferase [Treponema sp.]
MNSIDKSSKLNNVCYDIRGPVLKEAKKLEDEGFKVIKLNIGNPAAFGFNAPDEILHDMIVNLQNAQGYGDSHGLFAARKAVMHDFQTKGVMDVGIDDIYIGNGVSELIMIAMQGLLDSGDEVLIPMPDYPLWTAAVTLSGGTAVHYLCDESAGWNPDLDDIRSKLSPRTRAIVIINPNNPTGAVYERPILEGIAAIAREHDLIVYADEIYSRIIYEGAVHIPMSTIAPDILTISFDGLSKAWRAAGFRAAWMVLSGNKKNAAGYVEGLEMLSNMRLCANMPSQFGIQTALGGYQSVNDLILPGGRLREQRDVAVNMVNAIPGLSAVMPKGALYCFPKVDIQRFNISDDQKFILDLLLDQHLLLVQGTGFNWKEPDHFRIVFLPDKDTLADAMRRLAVFLDGYRQR